VSKLVLEDVSNIVFLYVHSEKQISCVLGYLPN